MEARADAQWWIREATILRMAEIQGEAIAADIAAKKAKGGR